MAEFTEKKYLDFEGLKAYDGKIKTYIGTELTAGDGATLEAAKKYADGLGVKYDAAGAAAGVQGELDKEIARAKAAEEAAQAKAEEGVAAAGVADGKAVAAHGAADAAQAAADKAQGDVNALAGKVGEVADGQTVMGVVNQHISDAAANDTAVRGLITANTNAIAAEKTRAEGIEGGLRTDVDAVSAKVTTLIGEDADKSVRTIANEELAKQLIAEGAAEALDTLAEIAAWIQEHPEDAAAMNKAIEDLEALVGAMPEGVTATTIVGYIQEAVAAEKTRAEEAEGGLSDRIGALESAVGESGSVSADIAAAVKAEADLRVAADDAIKGRLDALELIDHDHANKAELDLIASGDKAKWDAAAAQAHTHANAAELAKFVDGDKAKLDSALQALDIATGSANGTIAVKGTDVAVKGLGSAAFTEASAYDAAGAADGALSAAKTYTDTEVAALNDSFKAITATEINGLFTAAE